MKAIASVSSKYPLVLTMLSQKSIYSLNYFEVMPHTATILTDYLPSRNKKVK